MRLCRLYPSQFVLVSITVIFMSILACAQSQNLGSLNVNQETLAFDLLGEVDHTWQVEVVPGLTYKVVVASISSRQSLNQIQIAVGEGTANIASVPEVTESSVSVTFIAPVDGQVAIVVSSKTGERQEHLGVLTIKLEQVE